MVRRREGVEALHAHRSEPDAESARLTARIAIPTAELADARR